MRIPPARRLLGARLLLPWLSLGLAGCIEQVGAPADDPTARTIEVPLGWRQVGTPGAAEFGLPYRVGLDRRNAFEGASAAYISSLTFSQQGVFGSLAQIVSALPYRGVRLRWSAWLRPQNVSEYAGLWFRIDGAGRLLGFDNMQNRGLRGSLDWTQVSVVLDVPHDAVQLNLGALLVGGGDLLVDDARLEIVDSSVPVTDVYAGTPRDSLPASPHGGAPADLVPLNLDFEGTGALSSNPAALAWLRSNTSTFRTTDPGGDDSDLAPFGDMIGNAGLIALGESTHGTREFFTLKHRVFEYLVRNKGFTHFAIEGAWGEANEIDHYVRTGEGDARVLLSRLGFWTWNTEEVLALIEWMRAWNVSASPAQQVRFLGFDMQMVTLPADTVEAFVARTMPSSADSVSAWLACLRPFRRVGNQPPRPPSDYLTLTQEERARCRASLARIDTLLESYTGVAPTANVKQSARVLRQWERMAAEPPQQATVERDRAMAENVAWLREQAPAATRMMLWAHDAHVNTRSPWMGQHLRRWYGEDYRAVALLFGTGAFNAYSPQPPTGLRQFAATLTPPGSLESTFGLLGDAHLMFDARRLRGPGGSAGQALRGPVTTRVIGAVFQPSSESLYFYGRQLPDHFDHLFFVRETTASRLLPFLPWNSPSTLH